jgi:hypothetical protein
VGVTVAAMESTSTYQNGLITASLGDCPRFDDLSELVFQ